ncbi:hypothetical protein PtA15_12A445 [Puccinia triticina]|nr:uncharacterized protein PtA15_12A445 [Puccinia triticina]WAQ90456.1 hypothetical protein PtA15_12A445 [Puccinia triticina]
MPSRHHHLGRHGSHSNRRHIIPFGHPYQCTPVLTAIFDVNPSPSHSQVADIMQQTGLKRKQITSWFWRKRKELLEQDQETGSPLPSSSPALHQAISRPSSIPQARHGRHEHDEEYHPPSSHQIKQSSHDRLIHPNISRAKPGHRVKPNLPSGDGQNLSSSNPSSSTIPPASPTSAPQRPPLLIRCRLRPLAERVVHRTLDREEDQSSESNRSGFLAGSPLALGASPGYSSDLKTCFGPQATDLSASHQPDDVPSYISANKQSTSGSVLSATVCHNQRPADQIICGPSAPSAPRLATDPQTASPKQRQNVMTDPNEPPNILPTNARSTSHSDIYCLGLGKAHSSQDYSVSTARRMVSGTPTWLRPDRRFSYPGHGQLVDTTPRNPSNAFREPSSESTDSSTTHMDVDHGICFRVSQDDLGSAPNTNWSSLGHEVHRWSELSDVDGASRYSSESIESRASRCTNVSIEDYSALLNASSSGSMFHSSAGRGPEPGATQDLRDNRSQEGGSLGSRSFSHPFYPLDQTTRAMAGFQEQSEFSFASGACLGNQGSEVEEDPRLFMVQDEHQEFFDLLDWNPLGSFPNNPS